MLQGRLTGRFDRIWRCRVCKVLASSPKAKVVHRKSQLAIEHAYRLREREPQTWVFWVHSATVARFEESYRAIAEAVKIPGRNDPSAKILQMVKNWLQDRNKGKWLIVLDNADDISIFANTQETSQSSLTDGTGGETSGILSKYLPVNENGSILVTTRFEDAAFNLTGHYDNIIKIQPMSESESLALFEQKIGASIDRIDVSELIRELGMMALAITQAALYIRKGQPQVTVRNYVKHLRKDHSSRTKLLNQTTSDPRRDSTGSNSAVKTFYITFQFIKRNYPSAAKLFGIMSCFDRQGIQASLLHRKCAVKENGEDECSEISENNDAALSDTGLDIDFENDIQTLKSFSLVTVNINTGWFEMHRLVQLAARSWLKNEGEWESCNGVFIDRLNSAFPNGDFENWGTCQSLFAHAEAAMEQRPQETKALVQWTDLFHRAGQYAANNGICKTAEIMLRKVLREREVLLGKGHLKTIESADLLAYALVQKGKYDEAQDLYQQAINGYRVVLGSEHSQTRRCLKSIGSLKIRKGLLTEAEELLLYISNIPHPDPNADEDDSFTIDAKRLLAITYRRQGRLKEAEGQGTQVQEALNRMLGSEHISTFIASYDLATIYGQRGRLEEAEELCTQMSKAMKRVLGPEHPATLESSSLLADTYLRQSRLEEAEELAIKTSQSLDRMLGPEHSDTRWTLSILAEVYFKKGELEKAEEQRIRVLEQTKRVQGQEHPNVLYDMDRLAEIWKAQGRLHDAVEMLSDAVGKRSRIQGPDHPSTKYEVELLMKWQSELDHGVG
ncbi:MAG: hypothetical protein Q9160_003764 [Pyrenula sp. 1 TL-2023]